jgi:glycosidase
MNKIQKYTSLLLTLLLLQIRLATAQVDFRKETIYFLLPTRFFDGDPSNNRPNEWCSYGPNSPAITDPNDVPWRGDFKGLIQKLDYIKDLGFTAIWITPVVQNRGPLDYHGYHAWDFTKVDPRLESPGATFQDLINQVHARGMKIVLDIVTNHSGRFGIKGKAELKYNTDPTQSWYVADNASWQYDGMTPNPQDGKIWSRANLAKLPAPYNANLAAFNWPCTESFVNTSDINWFHHSGNGFVQGWDDTENLYNRAIAGDCPDLNTSSQVLRDYLVAAYTTFINMGVDAFRWDTMKHMDKTDALYFLDKFKAVNPNLFVFAEVAQKRHELHPVEEINPHWYTWRGAVGSSANSGMAVLDFYAEATFHNVFQDGGSFSDVTAAARYDNLYSDPSTNLTWLDNHDFGPNNDWNQRYGGTPENLAACMNFMFTWRGIPVVYYGTEVQFKKGVYTDLHDAAGIGQSLDITGRAYYGAEFTNAPNHKIYQHIKKLNAIRKGVPALQNGTYVWAGTNSSNSVGYIRKSGTSEVAVGLAKDGAATFNFTGLTNGTYRDAVTGKVLSVTNGNLSFTVTSSSAGIYVLNGPGMIGGNGVGYFESGAAADAPVVSIGTASGNYAQAIQVTLTASGVSTPIKIYYTTNGTTPTSSSTLYSSSITISTNTTLKAIAVDAQNRQSTVETATYTIGTQPGLTVYFKKPAAWGSAIKVYYWNVTPTGAVPTIAWPGAAMTYNSTTQWYSYKLTNTTSANLIFNDGTNQTGDLSRSADGWYKDGAWYNSNPDGTNVAPVLAVTPAGPYSSSSAVTVTLSATDDSGVSPTIYYTMDGTTPTTTSSSATGSKSLPISSTTTLKAFALDNADLATAIQSHTYTISVNNAPVVTVTPAGPYTFTTSVTVNISATDDSGVTPIIYYTIDGSTPTTSSSSAAGSKSLTFAATTTLKVLAVDNTNTSAAIQSHTYTLSVPNPTGLKIHLKTTWATPKVYYWNATPGGVTTTWPGVSMTSEGNGWYVFTIPNASCSNIIFSNNGASQTADLNRCNEGWYDNGTWYSSDPNLATGLKIHLKTTWTSPKIYYWNATPGGATTTWPGVSMTSEGNGCYVYTIPNASCSNIIFSNNGATQTADLNRCNEGWYSNGTWYNTLPAGRSEIIEDEQEPDTDALTLAHFPNPVSNNITISFFIRDNQHVSVKVFSDQGHEIMEPVNEDLIAGQHDVEINASSLKPGLYLYRIIAGRNSKVKKLMIIK